MKSKAKKREMIIRHIILILAMLWCTTLTIKNNGHIDTNKELNTIEYVAFTSAIYFVGGAMAHFFSMSGMFNKKRKALAVMIFYMFLYGSVWGGILGILSGRGFYEFMPHRTIFYFLNELPDSFISCFIVYFVYT